MSRDRFHPDRRMLLAGLGVGAVGVAAGAAPVLRLADTGASRTASSWWDRNFASLRAAGLAEWTGAVGESFVLETSGGTHMLKVAAVTPFPKSGPRPAWLARSQAFSVAFELLAGPPLPARDNVYQLTHRAYPPLPVYMGAPFALAGKSRLIAVFN